LDAKYVAVKNGDEICIYEHPKDKVWRTVEKVCLSDKAVIHLLIEDTRTQRPAKKIVPPTTTPPATLPPPDAKG